MLETPETTKVIFWCSCGFAYFAYSLLGCLDARALQARRKKKWISEEVEFCRILVWLEMNYKVEQCGSGEKAFSNDLIVTAILGEIAL